MISIDAFRELALSFENAYEDPHFEKTSFRVNKKIFATVDETNKQAALKLSPIDQSVFCSFDISAIYPVSGGWGKKGWTVVELSKVRKSMVKDALKTAYLLVTAKK